MSEKEYNGRQFKLMLDSISDYESGRSGLGKLVSDLEALSSVLEGDVVPFQDSFEPLWEQLEVTLAVMLDEGRFEPSVIDRKLIDDSISKLRTLITQNPH